MWILWRTNYYYQAQDNSTGLIQKSLQDFWSLRYSKRDGNAEEEHINRGRDTPSFCPTLQVLDMSTLGDAADVKFGNSGKFRDT